MEGRVLVVGCWMFLSVMIVQLTHVTANYDYQNDQQNQQGASQDPHQQSFPLEAVASCQNNSVTLASFARADIVLQLNICQTRWPQAATFLFNVTMFNKWSECLLNSLTSKCHVTARDKMVVGVGEVHQRSWNYGTFVCDLEANSLNISCIRPGHDGSLNTDWSMAMMYLRSYTSDVANVFWRGSETVVSAAWRSDALDYFWAIHLNCSCAEVLDEVNRNTSTAPSFNSPQKPLDDHDSAQLPRNAIIGIVVACLVSVVVLVTIITMLVIRRKRLSKSDSPSSSIRSLNSGESRQDRVCMDDSNFPSMATIAGASYFPRTNPYTFDSSTAFSRPSNGRGRANEDDDGNRYASIGPDVGTNHEYMGLDELASYNHSYKALVTRDPKLRPPMPLPLHVANPNMSYYSVAQENAVYISNQSNDTVSGQYVELVDNSSAQNIFLAEDYLDPISLSPYTIETAEKPHPYLSLLSVHDIPPPSQGTTSPPRRFRPTFVPTKNNGGVKYTVSVKQ